jgi:Ca2+/Na+ antiporter
MMICWLSNMVGAVAAMALVVAALVYMVSPKQGTELLKRIAVFLVGALFGLSLFSQCAQYIGSAAFLLTAAAVSVAAYWVRQFRQARPSPRERPQRPERRPSLPRGGTGV